ncbi:MAG: 1,4-dihydroxy-2-naphthoyl-CoA hydrolase [Anaerolineae bacterium]|nr:1,4-dihydroxy-2-naphthoyl-CoA hydrolase [Anaerolineae bacterium]
MHTPEFFQKHGAGYLPDYLDIQIVETAPTQLVARLVIQKHHLAPNGFLHAATVIALADTACGYGCVNALPEGAKNFTTVELKSNFLGTARQGVLQCDAVLVHGGRTTQVWDATVRAEGKHKVLALFRCTQMILYDKA